MSTKALSPTGFISKLFDAFRYAVKYVEKFFRFGASQTSWTVQRFREGRRWADTVSVYPAATISLKFLIGICLLFLWVVLVLWGLVRSL